MASTTAICTVFKQTCLERMASGGDTFKLALYVAAATNGAGTTAYSATNEASGTNYTAGGATLTSQAVTTSGTTAYADFADVRFSNSTVTAASCLIYNSTKANEAVQVHDFGGDVSSVAGNFDVTMPAAAAGTAITRLA